MRAAGVVAVVGSCLGLAGFLVLALGSAPARAAGAQASGGELYELHCASCHQADGLGLEGTFPPLTGNPAAADKAYVESVIRDGLSTPIEVFGIGYDTAMPPVVALTDDAEISEVADYVVALANQGGDGAADDPAEDPDDAADDPADAADDEVAGPVVGDVDRGKDLFTGASRFDGGGAPCSGCHTAGSVGNLGGQGLGPDLTGSFETLGGEAGLTGWLTNPPSATMQPLFADRPLTEPELADVVAFLGDAPNQEQPSGVDRLSLIGVGGLLVLIAGMAVVWRGMRQTYVERLRSTR